eukprot:scaffold22616_cov143-Isochrysis_galbana.AAC.1
MGTGRILSLSNPCERKAGAPSKLRDVDCNVDSPHALLLFFSDSGPIRTLAEAQVNGGTHGYHSHSAAAQRGVADGAAEHVLVEAAGGGRLAARHQDLDEADAGACGEEPAGERVR